jgi:uncharacterized protein (TIGR03085 family)
MAEVTFDGLERQQLCDLFVELGPDAPTLLEPWSTHDLAAHLVLREHDYLAAPGLILPGPWHRLAERHTAKLAERDFASLVGEIRSGPPVGFFRIGWVRRFPNLNEFFVHHEDTRRANGRGPRITAPELDAALWRNVARASWFLARRLRGVGLELEWAETNKRVRARRGEQTARLVGSPGELLLYLFGRRSVAQVEVAGEPGAITAVRETPFGM